MRSSPLTTPIDSIRRRGVRAAILPLALGAGVALAPATGAAQDVRGADEATFVWSGTIRAGGVLAVRNFNGPITVTEASGDRAEVRAEKRMRGGASPRDISFEVRQDNGVTICAVYRGRSVCDDRGVGNTRGSVVFTIALPHGARLQAATGNGDVSVERGGAEAEVTTGNGRVRVGQTEGRVTATTGNGDVEVDGAKGAVRVTTGNGRVYVTTSSGPVSATTGNGDVDVRMQALPRDAGDMSFTSGSGAIRVTLPGDFSGEIDASTGNGELRSDFEIRVIGRLNPQHVRGTIGSGGRLLRMQTGNGRIEIRKG